jgi:hypothetical protein
MPVVPRALKKLCSLEARDAHKTDIAVISSALVF